MDNVYNILHVLGGLDRGGTETMVMNLFRKIDSVHYKFCFVSHNKEQDSYQKEILENNGIIFYIPKYKIYNHFSYVRAWKKLFKEQNIDLVHGHVRSTASIYLKIAKKNNIKTILHSHSTNSRGNLFSRVIKKLYQSKATKSADELFSCSTEAANWLFGNKVVSSRGFQLIPNGIELDRFKYSEVERNIIRAKLNVNNELLIGHVGTFTEPKNHKLIIEIFKNLINNNNSIKLVLIGDGKLKPEILALVKRYNIQENVIFTNSVSNIEKYYNAMDVFLFPSIYEGLGMVLVEAQVNGLKCVISDKIPNLAIVNKEITVLSLRSKLSDWEDSLMKYKDNRYNRNVNLEQFEKFSIEYGVKVITELYNKLLGVKL